jgi:hypothetical protein
MAMAACSPPTAERLKALRVHGRTGKYFTNRSE